MSCKTIFFLTVVTVFSYSCNRYSNEEYHAEEIKAIRDLITEMVNTEYMLEHNDYGTNKPTLYIINELYNDSFLSETDDLTPHDYRKLSPLIKERIPKRILNEKMFNSYDKLNIQLIERTDYEQIEDIFTKIETEKTYGYLHVTRIIFNRNYSKGYIMFAFICGTDCIWVYTYEITNNNGSWQMNRIISQSTA